MGQIIPRIWKSKHMPRTLCWPIQYSHLEAAFSGRCTEDLRLRVHFWDKPVLVWRRSTGPPLGKRTLLTVEYDPDDRGLWEEGTDYRFAIGATVYPLPVETLRATGLTKRRMREILVSQLRGLTPPQLPSDRWRFHLGLGPRNQFIECIACNWTGIREEAPVRTLVTIAEGESGEEVLHQ